MLKILTTSLVTIAAVRMLAPAALAQSTMIRGKVLDTRGQARPGRGRRHRVQGRREPRKYQTKTDRRGEFVQLLTESGEYQVTVTPRASAPRPPRSASGSGSPPTSPSSLAPGAGGRPRRPRRPPS